MTDNLPDKPEESIFPDKYWPESRNPHKADDGVLRSIINEIAHTNLSQSEILKNHGVSEANFYKIRNMLPKFYEAVELAKEVRRERLNEEILEIADKEFEGYDLDRDKFELQHRALKIKARQHLAKAMPPAKGMEKFSINVGASTDSEGKPVQVVQINYGDKK